MKKSNMILSGSVLIILAICLSILLIARVFLNDYLSSNGVPLGKSEKGEKIIYANGIKSLYLKGNWHTEIVRSDEEKIIVTGPKDLLEDLWVKQQNDSLEIHMVKLKNDERKLRLKMTMPIIQLLRFKGVAVASISGFNLESLTIHSEGVTSVHGEEGSTKNLTVTGKGVSKYNFEDFPTHDAHLDFKGTVKIDLAMTGGGLTGKIEGVGAVRYKGKISKNSMELKGQFKLTQL